MPNLVAFQVENGQLAVVIAKTNGRRVSIDQTLLTELPQDISDAEIGESLKTALASHKVGRADAIAVVGRTNAEIRELDLPPAPDNELPDLVKFKARSDFGSLNDNWALDFIPFDSDPESSRHVLAAAISPAVFNRATRIAETAGLKLIHVVLRPFAAVDLLDSELDENKSILIVDDCDNQVDVTVTSGKRLASTRTVRTNAENYEAKSEQLLKELRRTIASSSSRFDGKAPEQILVIGDGAGPDILKSRFTEGLEIKTRVVDPFAQVRSSRKFESPDQTHFFSGILGAIQQTQTGETPAIDFLNPRKPIVDKSHLTKFVRLGGIAAAGLMLIAGFCWWILNSQATEIADLEMQLRAQTMKNEGSSPEDNAETILKEVAKFDSFKHGTFNWLDEMAAISEQARTPDDLILDSFDVSRKLGNVPTINLRGRISSSDMETAVRGDLINGRYPELKPGNSTGSGDADYPEKFNYTIKLGNRGAGLVNKETNRQAIELRQNMSSSPEQIGETSSETQPSESSTQDGGE